MIMRIFMEEQSVSDENNHFKYTFHHSYVSYLSGGR